jgi:hypothetical protein
MTLSATKVWAREEFGHARLGDERRTSRAVAMAATALARPGGRVSDVFSDDADRQGAYDFLESDAVHAEGLITAMGEACARRCAEHRFVFVPVDGSSLRLIDRYRAKDFGVIGTYQAGARGIWFVDAIAVSPAGVPLGCFAIRRWTRGAPLGRRRSYSMRVSEKETQHWLDAIDDVRSRLQAEASHTRAWFQLDREADGWPKLDHLSSGNNLFTVRAAWNRRVRVAHGRSYLREVLRRRAPCGSYLLEVSEGRGRTERLACMETRAATVTLDLLDKRTKKRWALKLNAVWTREVDTTPRGEKRLEWLLLTNASIDTPADVELVVHGYAHRWRIEDFHRSWKSGVCDVESTQLRATSHVIKCYVARCRGLTRRTPQAPRPRDPRCSGKRRARARGDRRRGASEATAQETRRDHPRLDADDRASDAVDRSTRRIYGQVLRWPTRIDHDRSRTPGRVGRREGHRRPPNMKR